MASAAGAASSRLRPETRQLWQSLAPREQRRFLAHLQPWWDTHRHRAAPATAARIAALRDGCDRVLAVGRVVGCTGSALGLHRVADPLVAQLLASGLARRDALGIGVDTAPAGALLDARGAAQHRLFAVGPLRRGTLWESTAVPEIREEARGLAERVARAVEPRSERVRAVA